MSSEVAVHGAVHGAVMEGLAVTPTTRADADEHTAGTINADELIGRVDVRRRVG